MTSQIFDRYVPFNVPLFLQVSQYLHWYAWCRRELQRNPASLPSWGKPIYPVTVNTRYTYIVLFGILLFERPILAMSSVTFSFNTVLRRKCPNVCKSSRKQCHPEKKKKLHYELIHHSVILSFHPRIYLIFNIFKTRTFLM